MKNTTMLTLGGQLNFNDMNVDDFHIEDIAHALSMICRFGGHCDRFYSVAEHSCLLADYFTNRYDFYNARIALMHDAGEAYTGDIIQPLRAWGRDIEDLEGECWKLIAEKFGLPGHITPEVKEADTRLCLAEMIKFFKPKNCDPSNPAVQEKWPEGLPGNWQGPSDPLVVSVNPSVLPHFHSWQPGKAKVEFLNRFERLQKMADDAKRGVNPWK